MTTTESEPFVPIERIDASTPFALRAGHEFRYRLAAGYIEETDVVLDAGCGVGYGAPLVQPCHYVGVDIAPVVEDQYAPFSALWINADLCEWIPDFQFDVALCFETLEHVENPERLIDVCCFARRLVICSVPIVPTVGENPFHLHDFTMFDVPRMFETRDWQLVQCVLQPSELSAVYIFGR